MRSDINLRLRLYPAPMLATILVCRALAQQSSPPPFAFVFQAGAEYFGQGEFNFGSASFTSGCEEPSHSYSDEFFSASKTSTPNSVTATVTTSVNSPTLFIIADGDGGGTLFVYALGPPGTGFHLQETWTGQASVSVSVGGQDGWSATTTDFSRTASAQIGPGQTGSQQASGNDASIVDSTTQSTRITCFGNTYTLATGYRFGSDSRSGSNPTQEQGQAQASSVVTVSGNLVTPPTAVIDPVGTVAVNTPVTLNGSHSYDNDSDSIIQYQWTIQNSNGGTDTLSGPSLQYTWTRAGTYGVTLTVKDSAGQTGSASTTVSVDSVTINTVQMFDSHTLQVDVIAQLSNNAVTKGLSISTTPIGGDGTLGNTIMLDSTNCSQCSLTLGAGVVGTFSNSFRIDLTQAGGGVPRFIDNQVFDVMAVVSEADNVTATATKPANQIPLPVVHVHGIFTDCLPGPIHPARIPTQLFQYLTTTTNHPYVEDDGFPTLSAPYPTLVSFDYPSVGEDAVAAAGQLRSFIWGQLLDPLNGRTYADKVNIVAHSLGGIVTRTAIMSNGLGGQINRLILVGSPNEGVTLAAIAFQEHVSPFAAALTTALDWLLGQGIGGDLSNTIACLEQASSAAIQQMLPTYAWYGNTQADVMAGHVRIPAPRDVNPFLTNLNSLGLDARIRYYTIASSTGIVPALGVYTATYLWQRNWIIPPTGALWQGHFGGPATAYGGGDGIVPIQSQAASDQAWPIGTGPGKLNRFDDVFGVFHTDYFKTAHVNQDIELILWHAP